MIQIPREVREERGKGKNEKKERAISSRREKVPGLNRAIEDIQAVENNVYGQVQIVSNQLQKLKKMELAEMSVCRF